MTDVESAEITLATLREWAERAAATPVFERHTHVAGYRKAARDALAILDARDLPPGTPVVFTSSVDEPADVP